LAVFVDEENKDEIGLHTADGVFEEVVQFLAAVSEEVVEVDRHWDAT
jgi:hypothetical protein